MVVLAVVGPPGHGKTSLVSALGRQDGSARPPNESLACTQQIWSQKVSSPLLNGSRKLTLVTWDFSLDAGDVAQATILVGLSVLYVVVCDLEQGLVGWFMCSFL